MTKKLYILSFCLFAIICGSFTTAHSQSVSTLKGNGGLFWKRYRVDYFGGAGVSNFLGDLGGAGGVGTHWFKDLNFRSTRYGACLGVRYKLNPMVALRVTFSYIKLYGDDKLTDDIYRNYRNLSFRTPLYEGNFCVEYNLIREQMGHRYRINGVTGRKMYQINSYIFAGIGAFYFNPRGKYKGNWYNLRDKGTEGQGLYEGLNKYSQFQMCIPIGIGFRYALTYRISLGFEIAYRKTFTDYIDDVSRTYPDLEYMRQERGFEAAGLSDPSVGYRGNQTAAGQQRGNPNNTDSYFFSAFTVNLKMRTEKGRLIPLF